MTSTCPQGHASTTDDFCDVCGTPIEPATGSSVERAPSVHSEPTSAPTLAPEPLTPVPNTCPNCQASNAAEALFCEDCGYDFTTGQLPPPSTPPAQIDPISGRLTPPTPQQTSSSLAWVAEVWVDPDWFSHQQTAGSCPTSGVPTVVPLRGDVQLIGRRSRSRNINPEIDCSSDGAISHRHAELSLAGEHWSVKDLGSTNGTFVGAPGRYPDTQLPPQERRELADSERIYLGAWTRIVIRKATEAEKATASTATAIG